MQIGRVIIMHSNQSQEQDIFKQKKIISKMSQEDKNSKLIDAAINGHEQLIKLFIDSGADVNWQDENGRTALMYAAINGHKDIVSILIDNHAKINTKDNDGCDAFLHAITNNEDISIVKMLYNKHTSNIDELTLMKAAKNEPILAYIVDREKRSYIEASDDSEKTVLMIAAENGRTAAVKFLLEKGATNIEAIDDCGSNALMIAAENGHIETVEYFTKYYNFLTLTKDDCGRNALMISAENGHTDIAKYFIENNVFDINEKDSLGKTALMYAAEKGHTNTACMLLEKGAQINLTDELGRTALIYAVENGHKDTVDKLCCNGANIEVKNNNDSSIEAENYNKPRREALMYSASVTPLMYAARNRQTDSAEILICNGVDINAKDKYECNALIYAAREGHEDVCELLINLGADLTKAKELQLSSGLTNEGKILLSSSGLTNIDSEKQIKLMVDYANSEISKTQESLDKLPSDFSHFKEVISSYSELLSLKPLDDRLNCDELGKINRKLLSVSHCINNMSLGSTEDNIKLNTKLEELREIITPYLPKGYNDLDQAQIIPAIPLQNDNSASPHRVNNDNLSRKTISPLPTPRPESDRTQRPFIPS